MSSEARHTPGPWQVREWPREWTIEHAYPAHSELAVLSKGSFDDPLPNEGNAHLMAAAPELLHACKMAEETIGWITDASRERYVTETLRKAIAKAEGRQ